jgi:hypothetical protein
LTRALVQERAMPDAKTILEYLGDLGQRVKNLDQRLAYNQARDDSLNKTANSFATLVDRMTRAQDRATYREFRDFERERADREYAEGGQSLRLAWSDLI